MKIREVLEKYCDNCEQNNNCWRPCETVITAIKGKAKDDTHKEKS